MKTLLKASKLRLRFTTARNANITVEDLHTLDLKSLNEIALKLDSEKEPKKSFLSTGIETDSVTELKLSIVVAIIEYKEAERVARASAASKATEKAYLESLLNDKQKKDDKKLSAKDIKEKLAQLG